jgi:hypothetical protein
VYGVHTLTLDRATGQPPTRRRSEIRVPADVTEFTIEGRGLGHRSGGGGVTIPRGPR